MNEAGIMGFIEMWEEADEEDARIGGMDSVPEWEHYDYVEALLMKVRGSIREHKEKLKEVANHDGSRPQTDGCDARGEQVYQGGYQGRL